MTMAEVVRYFRKQENLALRKQAENSLAQKKSSRTQRHSKSKLESLMLQRTKVGNNLLKRMGKILAIANAQSLIMMLPVQSIRT